MNSDLNQSIILITSKNENNRKFLGTGFIIDKIENKTYIVTCSHVVTYAGGEESVIAEGIPAKVIERGNDNDFDLAVLEVEGLSDKPKLALDYLDTENTIFTTVGFYDYYYDEPSREELSPRNKQIIGFIGERSAIYSLELKKSCYEWELNPELDNLIIEGYSGSPVYDVMRDVVIGVVKTSESSGEKGTAISIEALREIWQEMPSELLPSKVNALKDDTQKLSSENILSINYSLIAIISLSLFIISTISVFISYNCFDDAASNIYPWQEQFTEKGYIIEIGRSLIFFAAELFLFLTILPEEFANFSFLKSTNKENRRVIKYIRFLMIITMVLASIRLFSYHFYTAPEELFKWTQCQTFSEKIHPLNSEDGFLLYNLPYRWYLPYSFINYIIIVCPVVAVCLYATIKDFKSLYKNKNHIHLAIEKVKLVNQKLAVHSQSRQVLCREIYKLLNKFKSDFIFKLNRYSAIFFTVSFGVFYEMIAGRITLAKEAEIWSGVALLIFAIVSCSIYLGYLYYESIWKESSHILSSIECQNSEFDNKNGYIYLMFYYFRTNLFFTLGLLCIISTTIIFIVDGSELLSNTC